MNTKNLFLLCVSTLFITNGCAGNKKNGTTTEIVNKGKVTETIIGLERAAMEQWNNGNPDGFIKLSAEDVIYIDPFFEQKLEGIEKLKEYYNSVRGQIKVEKYEMQNPVVQITEKAAVLTYNLRSQSEGKIHKWNCTEVYRLEPNQQWKIIHTHWSIVKPLQ